jgi:glycosyltransferase involved in cell wall biosynthesis
MALISVVMGVFNGAPTLGTTLDSILMQTQRDFECIVVDDGSTDDTPRILAAYAARDPRIRVIRQENTGLTRALITGCAEARGTYIARHDCGDTSESRRFALQARLLEENAELVFVSCWTAYVGPEGEPLYDVRGTGTAGPTAILDSSREWGVIDGPTHHGSVMMRRDAYQSAGGYRAAFAAGQDWDLWYRLAALGKFQIEPETLYTARITPDSISGGSRTAQQALATLSLAAMRARGRGEDDAEFVRQAAAVQVVRDKTACGEARGLYAIGEALRRRGDMRARRYLRRAMTRCPFLVKVWVRYAQSFF